MRRLVRLALVSTLIAGSIAASAASASASAATTIVVGPGQSIQAAVNHAAAGSTISIKPGIYYQSVLVTKSLRIRGSGNGPGGTVLRPGNPTANFCASHGEGICVVSFGTTRVSNATVDDLRVENYKDSGVIAFHASGLSVYNVVAVNNGGYGIARFDTTGGQLVTNTAIGSGEAGLYIGDSANADVFVAGNHVSGNGFGIFYRHSRNATFEFNTIVDNCIGILMASGPPTPPTGAAQVRYNTIRDNQRICPKSDEGGPPFAIGGAGIVLLGATDVVIAQNAFLSNRGSTPFSGGIVLLNGSLLGAGPSTHNVVRNNTAYKDAPADIVNHSGGTNQFSGNYCSSSIPSGLCLH